MACYFVVIFALLCSASGSPVHGNQEPKKVEDFTADIEDVREEHKETEVDPKRTELFEVPAQPGVDSSDTLHDSKQRSISSSQDVDDLEKENRRSPCNPFAPWTCHGKVEDFTADIEDVGEEYKEIEVDPKRTELFEVPAQPGVDSSDTLHDSKQRSISSSQDVDDLEKENRRSPCNPFAPWTCYGKIEQSGVDHKADSGDDLTKE